MKIIGITGGIGTGKSTILNILREEYDAYVVETDRLAHQLMEPGMPAYQRIVEVFGQTILKNSGEIDRERLGFIVFNDSEQLKALNEIVHPAVKDYIKKEIRQKRVDNVISLYVIEAALLIEDGYKEICDEIWGVQVGLETRITRLLDGRGGTRQNGKQLFRSNRQKSFIIVIVTRYYKMIQILQKQNSKSNH